MFKINLSEYKESKIYFQLFDVILKDLPIKKENYLIEKEIAPSSYRLSRKQEQNIGKSIINKLAEQYNLMILSDDEIDELEKMLNKIYFDMYYKIVDKYNDYLNYINDLIEKKLIVFPILKLFKIFLLTNSSNSLERVFKENKNLFDEVVLFNNFYNSELLEIFNILKLFFDESLPVEEQLQDYNNVLSYQILASRSFMKEKYIEAIYFSTKAQELLISDANFKRYLVVDRTLMNSLLCVGRYELCYEIANKHLLSVQSLNFSDYEKAIAEDFICVSLLGLKKYEQIYNRLKDKQSFNINEISCLLIAMFKLDKNLFNNYVSQNINFEEMDEKYQSYFKQLFNYLEHNDKKQIETLKQHSVMKCIFKILKNI